MVKRSRTFYGAALTAEEDLRLLEAPRDAGLDEEIALVRTRIRTLAGLTDPEEGLSIQQQALLLRAIDLLARLIQIKSRLQPNQEDLLADINEQILLKLEKGAIAGK